MLQTNPVQLALTGWLVIALMMFEWVHWWTYVLLSVGSTYWWLSLISPAIMLFFVLFVTGIPPTGARAIASRGDAYREYQRTTSPFFPWFPRRPK